MVINSWAGGDDGIEDEKGGRRLGRCHDRNFSFHSALIADLTTHTWDGRRFRLSERREEKS